MARVTVRMFSALREAAGDSSVWLEADDIAQLLSRLKSKYGSPISGLVDLYLSDPDSLVILINGRNSGPSKTLHIKLSDGDEVALFPPVSGG